MENDICIFSVILSAASGFQTGIKRKREEEDDGDLNIDGDDSEEYGKPQYPLGLVYLFVKLVYLFVILACISVKLVWFSVKLTFYIVTSLFLVRVQIVKQKCCQFLENPKIYPGLVLFIRWKGLLKVCLIRARCSWKLEISNYRYSET